MIGGGLVLSIVEDRWSELFGIGDKRMTRLKVTRVLAILGALLAAAFGCLAVWFNIEFNRVYFPSASVAGAIADPSVAISVVALVYFSAVSWTGRWIPWQRKG